MFTVALESVDVPLFAGLRQPLFVWVDVPRYTPRTSGKSELSSSPPPQPYNTREHNNPTTPATNDTCARVIVVSFPLCATYNSSIPLLPPSALHVTTTSKNHHTWKIFLRPGSMAECPSPSRSVIMRRILRDFGYLYGGVLDAATLASTPRSHPTARRLGQRQSRDARPINSLGLYGTAPVGPSVYASG